MHVIFSRKGFDSSSGGMPSPILPDGTLLSMPIPSEVGPSRYCDLTAPDGRPYSRILRELGWRQSRWRKAWRSGGAVCHADPDLRVEAQHRPSGWQPAFGQIGVGQTQLAGHDIGAGDVFLFFGLFRATERVAGQLRYQKAARPQHIVYGWLTVDTVVDLSTPKTRADALAAYPWLITHPHACDPEHWARRITASGPNRIYIGRTDGTGALPYKSTRVLTQPGFSASRWKHFPWMGRRKNSLFSRCNAPAQLTKDYFDTHIGRWQELVVRSRDYPNIGAWVEQVVSP